MEASATYSLNYFFNLKLKLPSCLPDITNLSYSTLSLFTKDLRILKVLNNLLLYHIHCLLSISHARMKSSIKMGISFFFPSFFFFIYTK